MAGKSRTYATSEITVIWKPDICIHSENCAHGLPKVFDPNRRPWVDLNEAEAGEIRQTIDNCPSGALSYGKAEAKPADTNAPEVEINVRQNGPLIVRGEFKLTDAQGKAIETSDTAALCRCGASNKKPFCDGAHKSMDFEG